MKKKLAVSVLSLVLITVVFTANAHAAHAITPVIGHSGVMQGQIPYIESPTELSEMPSSWAVEQVIAAISWDIVPAALQSDFTQAITRAEFAHLAVNLYELIKGEITGRVNFVDTNDDAVEKAAYIGLVVGVGGNRFDPDGALTREQAAVMLSRLADALDLAFPDVIHEPFYDDDLIGPWAFNAVGQMKTSGIMRGIGDNRFAPQYSYTREQSIVTIMRLFDILGFPAAKQDGPTVRVSIYIPDAMFATALEFIGEYGNYRYYLSVIMSGSIVLTFEDGTEATLSEALARDMITIPDLILNGLQVIAIPHRNDSVSVGI